MPCAPAKAPEKDVTPHSDMAVFFVERNYQAMGCDRWDTRRVQLLCAKIGDTPKMMAARLRLRPFEFRNRMETDSWTKQDGLILTILEREIDLLKGGIRPAVSILP